MATPSRKLLRFVRELVDARYGGQTARLAEALGITVSSLHRGAKGVHGQTYSELTLLRLAYEAGEPPGTIFRLAGKADVAELLERLYPARPSGRALAGPERELLDVWGRLDHDSQAAVMTLLRRVRRRA